MDQKKIGGFIAELRKSKNLSQAELGEKLGVTNKTVSRWENGNYMPDISIMQLLCKELDIGINDLLSGERLTDESFRQHADENVILSLEGQKRLKREKQITGFLEGGGTGLLISSIYSPDSTRKIIVISVAIIMILISWIRRKAF